ncbi:TIM-barrel domain-containing protein, partial [Deinococcus pimensis]|uniref:TIM-barrel domain-containing protein n=1 Tax=Deinococcus pimensis TaxID=309888 RepID=UPI00048399B2
MHPSFRDFDPAVSVTNLRAHRHGVRFGVTLASGARLRAEVTFYQGGFVRVRFGDRRRVPARDDVDFTALEPDEVSVSRWENHAVIAGERLCLRLRLDVFHLEVGRDSDGWETLWASGFDDLDPAGRPRVLTLGVTSDGRMAASFALDPTEHVYGLGEQFTRLDRYGQTLEGTSPFFASSKGYGVLFNSARPLRHEIASPRLSLLSYVVTSPVPALEYVVLDGPDLRGVISRLWRVTTREASPPEWALGLIVPTRDPGDVTERWREHGVRAEVTDETNLVCWGSRAVGTLGAMAAALRGALGCGLSGQPWWGNTVNNSTSSLTPELFVRWSQFGLLSSHVQYVNPARAPWTFGPRAEAIFARYARLRSELRPYLHHLAWEAREHGWPLMRAMTFEFPDDPTCLTLETQYMLGPDLLVAPVLTPAAHVTVYLPDGEWIEALSNRTFTGPRWLRLRELPLESMPLYMRSDAAIPLALDPDCPEGPYTFDLFVRLGFQRTFELPGGRVTLQVERAGREVFVDARAGAGRHTLRLRG